MRILLVCCESMFFWLFFVFLQHVVSHNCSQLLCNWCAIAMQCVPLA